MLRRCRHLKAFEITTKVLDASNAGLPPWGVICQDCAAPVFEALETVRQQIESKHPSGKSQAAVTWARTKRLLADLGECNDTLTENRLRRGEP